MTTSKFWKDIELAVTQVGLNPERRFFIYSQAEDLTAEVECAMISTPNEHVVVRLFSGKREAPSNAGMTEREWEVRNA